MQSLKDRSEAKLRYAAIHLAELKAHGLLNGSDFERAHHESFLFHMLGVRDTILAELNHHYGAGLAGNDLSLGKLAKALKSKGIVSPELKLLVELNENPDSWYAAAKAMRDHSTHLQGASRRMLVGGEEDGLLQLRNPATGSLSSRHSVELFEQWHQAMSNLVAQVHTSLAP